MKADLAFNNIDFAYPSRPGSLVLSKFNLRVMACQTIGLVGGSGSGKSTVISLPERFYDPFEGEILLDGINIKCLQLKWLRSQMGLVDQETVLFATSIKENIQFGKGDAIDEEIIRAAKAAYAHSFITQLPHGYDTLVSTNSLFSKYTQFSSLMPTVHVPLGRTIRISDLRRAETKDFNSTGIAKRPKNPAA